MTIDLRKKILSQGPIQIVTAFPTINGRSFSQNYYTKQMSNGEQVKREWLIYSKVLDSVHCFSALLKAMSTVLALVLRKASMIGSICRCILKDMRHLHHISTIIPNGRTP